MQWIVNRLRGELRVVARGPFPERLMNVCAQNGISFWALEWRDGHTLSMTVRQEDRKQLWKLAERVGCTVETEGSRGLPAFLARFRTRYAFLAGFALSLAAVCILSSFVLTIQVTGNETVPTGVILSELRRLGDGAPWTRRWSSVPPGTAPPGRPPCWSGGRSPRRPCCPWMSCPGCP